MLVRLKEDLLSCESCWGLALLLKALSFVIVRRWYRTMLMKCTKTLFIMTHG